MPVLLLLGCCAGTGDFDSSEIEQKKKHTHTLTRTKSNPLELNASQQKRLLRPSMNLIESQVNMCVCVRASFFTSFQLMGRFATNGFGPDPKVFFSRPKTRIVLHPLPRREKDTVYCSEIEVRVRC